LETGNKNNFICRVRTDTFTYMQEAGRMRSTYENIIKTVVCILNIASYGAYSYRYVKIQIPTHTSKRPLVGTKKYPEKSKHFSLDINYLFESGTISTADLRYVS